MDKDWKERIIKEKLGGKRDWTEKERLELCHQLDKELETQFNSREKKPMEDGWTEDNWKEKMSEHPIFAPYLDENEGKTEINAKVNDLSEGLAQLKYSPDHNTPIEIAINFKEDGINHFKYKKYRLAKANFTEALKQTFEDDTLRAQLYNNRAAAECFLENYRSSIKDCDLAIQLKPDYSKAVNRAIQCAERLKSWNEVILWCDKGLQIIKEDDELDKKKKLAKKELKVAEAQKRKKEAEQQKKEKQGELVYEAILKRNLRLDVEESSSRTDIIASLQPTHSIAMTSAVQLSDSQELIWPVLFLYPEVNEHDCILEFNENDRFIDHLNVMFANPPEWDPDHIYVPKQLDIYFVQQPATSLVQVQPESSLFSCLTDKRYLIKNVTPEFLIMVRDSEFTKDYLKKRETGIAVT